MRSERILTNAIAFVLLAMMFLLAGGAALRESVTSDEVAHIGAGLSYLQRLDLRYNEEHPPLTKTLAAIPLIVRGTRADYSSPAWLKGEDFLVASLGEWVFGDYVLTRWNDASSTLVWARLPMLLLTLALGWAIFACARRLGGDWGGLLCLGVYSASPVFLAFGPLVATDIAIAFFFLLTLWAMAGLWEQPDRKNTLRTALALGGAILSKFTAPFLLVAFIAFALTARWCPVGAQPLDSHQARRWRGVRWRAMWRATWWAGVLVYACYLLLSWNQRLDIPGLAGHGTAAAALGRLLMPPWLVLRGLAWVVITGDRPTFLLGQSYGHGVWFYFPVMLVLKSAPGFLGLLLTVFLVAMLGKRLSDPPAIPKAYTTLWRVLWVSLVLFTVICILSRIDIGIRHFSVPLVLLILMLAPLPRLLGKIRPASVKGVCFAAAAAFAVSCLATGVSSYPYYVPYVSSLGAGRPAHWLVNDSNLDWNQGLPDVAEFARRHSLQDLPLDMYGFSGAAKLVPQSRPWDCQAPSAEDAGLWAVVSANMILDAHNCAWLMDHPHEALAGGSMYAVRLPSPIPSPGTPGGPPSPEARHLFLRMPFDIRSILQGLVRSPEEMPQALAVIMETRKQAPASQR